MLRKLNVTSTPRKLEAHIKQTLLAGVNREQFIFKGVNFTQKSRLASISFDINRVLALLKKQNVSRLIQRTLALQSTSGFQLELFLKKGGFSLTLLLSQ